MPSIEFDSSKVVAGLTRGVAAYEHDCKEALDKLADEVVAAAKSLVPVDSGALKNSIKKREAGRDDHGPFVDVGTDNPVGVYQEYGTEHAAPQPFMRPALAEAPAKFGRFAR